jgi:DNA-binding response OmpR family regulator
MTRILVVEDEPTIAMALRDDLEMEGYKVDVTGDGATALNRANEGVYDLILLDIMLPKKDGLTVCRELRTAGVRTPIIMLTARAQELDKITGLESGADDYITKPFSPRELVARIRALLRRTGAAGLTAPLEFGDVVVDFQRFEASRSGKKLDLTALEFRLLRVLVDNRGRVLSIDELLEKVWGKDVFLTDRVVYTHVNNLRSKIEQDPSRPRHLISVRGAGYRFDADVLNGA